MKKSYFLKLALSEFHVHKKRFNLTVLAISWGVCSILVLLAFGQGMKDRLTSTIKNVGDNIIMIRGRKTMLPFAGLPTGRRINFSAGDAAFLKNSIQEIKYAGGTYNRWESNVAAGKKEADFIEITGVEDGYGKARFLLAEQGGRFINPKDISEKRKVIFMGRKVAKQFFDLNNAVGKTLMINNIPFTVIGLLKKKDISASFGSDEDYRSYIPASTFAALYGNRYYDRIIISISGGSDSEAVVKKIRKVLAAKYRFDPKDLEAIRVRDSVFMLKKLGAVMLGFQVLLGFIGGITLMIAGVGLANIMYASIKRRTREIGVKIAIGARPAEIMKQIIAESFLFSAAGGAIGGVMAFFMLFIFSKIPIKNEALKFFMNARLSINVWISTAIVLMIVTFFAGFFPARSASKQNPIDSLRYE